MHSCIKQSVFIFFVSGIYFLMTVLHQPMMLQCDLWRYFFQKFYLVLVKQTMCDFSIQASQHLVSFFRNIAFYIKFSLPDSCMPWIVIIFHKMNRTGWGACSVFRASCLLYIESMLIPSFYFIFFPLYSISIMYLIFLVGFLFIFSIYMGTYIATESQACTQAMARYARREVSCLSLTGKSCLLFHVLACINCLYLWY